MRVLSFVIAVVVFNGATLGTARAADATDGRGVPFQDDLISNPAGQWNLTRQIRGREVRNTVEALWVLNHQFLQVHFKDVALPPACEALVMIGYRYADHRYVAHWTDTYDGKFSAAGVGTRSGNAVEGRFSYPDGPFYNTLTWEADAKRWVMRLESQGADGKRSLFALDTLTRD